MNPLNQPQRGDGHMNAKQQVTQADRAAQKMMDAQMRAVNAANKKKAQAPAKRNARMAKAARFWK